MKNSMNVMPYLLMAIIALSISQWLRGQAVDDSGLHLEDAILSKIPAARRNFKKNADGKVISIVISPRSDEELEAIDFTVFSSLTNLTIFSSKLTKRSLVHLGKIPPKLLTLHITGAQVDEKELGVLLQKQKSLQLLFLDGTSITDKTLADVGELNELILLTLHGTKITDKGLMSLANMQKLGFLDLSDTSVSDAGLRELKKLPWLAGLTLDGTKVTDAGILELGEREYPLSTLSVRNTKVTENGKAALQELLPDLRIK